MPIMPVVRGWPPGKPPPPITVMATGASSFSANSRNSRWARPRTTPPPQISSGRSAWAIISRSFPTSWRSGSGFLGKWLAPRVWMLAHFRFSRQGMKVYSISWSAAVTFFKKSMSTGPGRPVAATAKAWRITSGICRASRTRNAALVMGMAMPVESTS